jgi:DNA-binding HxlR family transcriptional regulator
VGFAEVLVKYSQFCSIAKASEVIGERWMLLVIRELLAGASSFTELQRGLGSISPSVLSTRLQALVEHGVIERAEPAAAQGRHYRLTQAGLELAPIIFAVARWGQRWTRSRMTRDELDVELLMLHVKRNFDAGAFPKDHAVVAFVFSDVHGAARRWWVLLDDGRTDLCTIHPGRPADVTLTCKLRNMVEVFTGRLQIQAALETGELEAEGPPKITRSLHRWLKASPFTDAPGR